MLRRAGAAPRGEEFTPKLVSTLREGYGAAELRRDALSGLTVAVVAAPLSMAIAVACGATPAQGLTTAVVGGFLVSALGGSRHQIGGPAGAFIVLMADSIARHGMEGFLLAVLLSGLMLAALGRLRLGAYVAYVPYPVTVGFTAGIGAVILASQLSPLLGLHPDGPEPGPILEKIPALWAAAPTLTPAAVAVSAAVIALILGLRRLRPRWPGMLIAVVLSAAATAAFDLPVETIGDRFGELPRLPPVPSLPPISLDLVLAVLPDAIAFAMLGAIESLLSAVVADGMTGRRHRPNAELVAQGVANVVTPLFGGLCVTGTIARTATNVRAGAHGPVSGMLHALFLLAFMAVAGPLAAHIPLAALAGVLATVAWGMVEWTAVRAFLRGGGGEALVLVLTFGITLFRDLAEAIVVGVALGSLIFLHRTARAAARAAPTAEVETLEPLDPQAEAAVWRPAGPFAFGTVAAVGAALERTADRRRALILDLSATPFIDSSAARLIESLAHRARRRGGRLLVAGANREVRRELLIHGARPPLVRHVASLDAALRAVRVREAAPPPG